MKTLLIFILILLAGCSSVPIGELTDLTPSDCRAYGVEVPDGSPVTGTIVRSEFGLNHIMYRECGASVAGCTKPIDRMPTSWHSPTKQYEIWYSDKKCIPEHEACHALYEKSQHTVQHFIRVMQGDQFAACPTNDKMIQWRGPQTSPEQPLLKNPFL